MTRTFPAKILLFGEYGLIENSKGLTVPYDAYAGEWQFAENGKVDQDLKQYADHLQVKFSSYLDVETMQREIDNGLYFKSDIPQGYGIGSSGALVAAVYDRYAYDKIPAANCFDNGGVIELKKIFSMMEGFFHGASSGFDPLLSYLNVPILIESPNEMAETILPHDTKNRINVFLLNTDMVSKTTPMIELFKAKMQEEQFADKMQHEFIPCNDACIDAFVSNKQNVFWDNLKNLSAWSLEYLHPMIPEKLHDIWQAGIESDAYYLKLCGSGGGGYMLGFARDKNGISNDVNGYAVQNVLSV